MSFTIEQVIALCTAVSMIVGTFVSVAKSKRDGAREDRAHDADMTVVAANAVSGVVDTVRSILDEERKAHAAERESHLNERHEHKGCLELVAKQNDLIAKQDERINSLASDIDRLRRRLRAITGDDTEKFSVLEPETET